MISSSKDLKGHICSFPPYGDVLVLHREYHEHSHYATLLTLNHSEAALKGQIVFSKKFTDLTYKRIANANDFGAERFNFDNPQQPVLKKAIERFKVGDAVNCRIRCLNVSGKIVDMNDDYYLVIERDDDQKLFQCHQFNAHLTSEYKVEPPGKLTIGSLYSWQGKKGIVISITKSHFIVQELAAAQKWQFAR